MAAVLRRFFSNPNTIYDCCKVLCLVLFFLGCSGFIKQNDRFICNRKTLLYTGLAVIWFAGSLLVCMFIKLQDSQINNLDNLVKSIIYLEIGMSTLVYLITAVSMVLNVKAIFKLYARIQALDEQLTTEFCCKLNYEKLMKKHVVVLCSISVFYMTVIIMAVARASHGHEFVVNLFAGIAYTSVTGGTHINCYAQINLVEVLSIRFRLLHKLLTQLAVCSAKKRQQQQQHQQKQVESLRSLISLVQDYHTCIRQINKIYSVCLASVLLHDFTLTTSELYLIFGSVGKNTTTNNGLICYVAVCMLLPLYKMTIAPIYCDAAIREGLKCLKIITEAELWFPLNREVRQMVTTSLLWRQDNKLDFKCGTLVYNKRIIAMVYLQIFNYLLILIQFRMTQEMGDQIEKQKNTIQEWIGADYI